jgi:integrase
MGKALVVYATRTGETKEIAELIAEGIRMAGHEAKVANVSSIQNEKDLQGYDAYVFGSATYHGEMMQAMKTMLFMAEKAGLGRVRVHDLRHTWASLALSRGIPLEVVSERLGHANFNITLGIYRHLLEEERRGWVLDLEELLHPATRAKA